MASTYVNNLRLEEIGTGEQSGTWGDTTNTNLEIIGQAVAWGTRAIANASTDNITIADGALDADRCLGLKLTGGGQACTVTLLPNTSSKTWFMYNATAAALTFTCGGGANVIIPAGHTKVIATDGLGSGGVVHDLLTAVNLAGTTTVDDLAVTDDLVVGDDLGVTGLVTIGETLAVTGVVTANAGVVVDNFTLDGTTLALSSGDFTLDVAGDIYLNADGNEIFIADGNVDTAVIQQTSSDFILRSLVSDKDIFFRGNDNGGEITALQLDMSDNGAARFRDGVVALPSISNLDDTDTGIFFPAADTLAFVTAGTERVRVDSSGRVGIGGTPNTSWRNDISNQEVLMLGTEATLYADGGITTQLLNNAFVNNSDTFLNISTRGASQYQQYQGIHKWFTAASANAGSNINTEFTTPKMVLDVGGNLLVGQSSTTVPGAGNTTAGTSIRGTAGIFVSRTTSDVSASTLQVNKTTAQGNIINIASGGTTIGSIGSISSDLAIFSTTSGHEGLRFGNGAIVPTDSAGGSTDNACNLGGATGRFSDLYLAGGVVFGPASGSTVGSQTLGDYEEGTWTPVVQVGFANPGHAVQYGHYTRIGDQVIAFFKLKMDAGTPNSERLRVGGLPYSSFNDGNQTPIAQPMVLVSASKGNSMFVLQVANSTVMEFYEQNATNIGSVIGTHVGNTFDVIATMIYEVA